MKNRPKLLLHTCCAPCLTVTLDRTSNDFIVTPFFYNPNIFPEAEHAKRLQEVRRYAGASDVTIIEEHYEPELFNAITQGLEAEPEGGERCLLCYCLRLEATARKAQEDGYPFFCTTLTVSPHKNADAINHIGRDLGEKYGIQFLEEDFKKDNGFIRSVELSKQNGLYRQKYCGCTFSI